MTGEPSPLAYAILAASEYGVKLVNSISESQAHFEICVRSSDGSRMRIQLIVQIYENVYLAALERQPSVFPTCCPQRHINYDGTFCLGWSGNEDMKILDLDAARSWWERIYAFLIKQRRASNTRKWSGEEWAHGHAAAASQLYTEIAAEKLGEYFVTDLKKNRLHAALVEREDVSKSLFKVYRGNEHIYSIWKASRKLINSKQRCPCRTNGNRKEKSIRSCRNHAEALTELGLHLHQREVEECKFFKDYANLRKCCGTMDGCPIAILVGIDNSLKKVTD